MQEASKGISRVAASPGDPTRCGLTRHDVLSGRDVAELLQMPPSTVLEYARRGVIPAHKLGRRWIFIRDEVDAAVRAAPATMAVRQKTVSP
jgi:excisionase family DNA binding protein